MLVTGSISGMLARTYARIEKLAWNMQNRTVELTVTSLRKQDITLIARYGIEDLTAPADVLTTPLQRGSADCELHLPEAKPVNILLKLGSHHPGEWAEQMVV